MKTESHLRCLSILITIIHSRPADVRVLKWRSDFMNFRRINQNINRLNAIDTYRYFYLTVNANWVTHETHIKQSTLAEAWNLKSSSAVIKRFEQAKLLTKGIEQIRGQYGTFPRNTYHIIIGKWVGISKKLLNEPISDELKGFLILLKSFCINYTNRCLYTTPEELVDWMLKLKEEDIKRLLDEAEQAGYIRGDIEKDKRFITLTRDDLFAVWEESEGQKLYRLYPNPYSQEECDDMLQPRGTPDYEDKPYPNSKNRTF